MQIRKHNLMINIKTNIFQIHYSQEMKMKYINIGIKLMKGYMKNNMI